MICAAASLPHSATTRNGFNGVARASTRPVQPTPAVAFSLDAPVSFRRSSAASAPAAPAPAPAPPSLSMWVCAMGGEGGVCSVLRGKDGTCHVL